ncbi:MAG TPA: hypothetical protein VIK86_02240 [Candidatus Paceibacterota bacterium]
MSEYLQLQANYSSDFNSVLHVMETKEVILNKFTNFREELFDKYSEVIEVSNNIMRISNEEFNRNIIHSNLIGVEFILNMKKYSEELMSKKLDAQEVLFDLNISAQNELYGKIFKCKAKERKPLDKKYVVRRVGRTYKAK